MMLKDALEPPVTRLKQFRDAVESGLSNVSNPARRVADADRSPENSE